MQNSKRFTIFLLIIGLNWINAQRHDPKIAHMITTHGWCYSTELYENHLPFDCTREHLYLNPDNNIGIKKIGILNKEVRSYASHFSDLYGIRIWDIQYRTGIWSRAIGKTRKDRKKIRKILKQL